MTGEPRPWSLDGAEVEAGLRDELQVEGDGRGRQALVDERCQARAGVTQTGGEDRVCGLETAAQCGEGHPADYYVGPVGKEECSVEPLPPRPRYEGAVQVELEAIHPQREVLGEPAVEPSPPFGRQAAGAEAACERRDGRAEIRTGYQDVDIGVMAQRDVGVERAGVDQALQEAMLDPRLNEDGVGSERKGVQPEAEVEPCAHSLIQLLPLILR